MSKITILALQGLSCMNCIRHVTEKLENLPQVESVVVTLQYAKVVGDIADEVLFDAVTEAGYQATRATHPDTVLTLSGLSCMNCVKHTREALENVANVVAAEVTTTQARIYGHADTNALILAVESAGYEACLATDVDDEEISHPKTEPLTETLSDTLPAAVVTPPSAAAHAAAVLSDTQAVIGESSASSHKLAEEQFVPARSTEAAASETEESDTQQLLLEGMSCASCVAKVQHALEQVPGVEQARVNLAERSALVMGQANAHALIAAVQKAGYGAEIIIDEHERRQRQQASAQASMKTFRWQSALALALGIPLMLWGLLGGDMMVTADSQPYWLGIGLLTFAIMMIAGGHFYRNTWRNLKNGSATMDTLIALGTGAAWIYSFCVSLWPQHFPPAARHLYYEASVMIIGLINLGHALEQRARQRSSQALERLLDLTPPTARLITEDGERDIPLAEVEKGMMLRLTTGDRVPVDGTILQGDALLDESMLTGESFPVQKGHSDLVHAGTVVSDGSVVFRADAVGSQTTLSRIIKLVRQAQNSKPEIGRLADRISAVFVPIVVAIAIISGAVWYFLGPQPQIVYTLVIATTVLIIACPCALGLATPMSIISGVGRAAELGVLVRDADALQHASTLDTLVFDKTGTLTEGKPQIVNVYTAPGVDESQAIRCAAALETGSNHPLALAIVQHYQQLATQDALPSVNAFRTLRGLGVSGVIEGNTMLLGNSALLEQQGVDIQQFATEIETLTAQGATPVLLAAEGHALALFSVRDTLRADSAAALQRLHQQGYYLVMLTGDNERTAQAIAQELPIDRVVAGVLPEGKAKVIQQLQQEGRKVAMVGDGINDAPALAQADVGIAMGGGSDIAIETASITLMRHSLQGVADALALSRATLRNMKQNLLGAFVYNSLGIPIAAGILYPFCGYLLNPVVAGAAMALSSITVVSNANRLLRFKPKQ